MLLLEQWLHNKNAQNMINNSQNYAWHKIAKLMFFYALIVWIKVITNIQKQIFKILNK
jgi:hypothetical protein